MITQDVLADLAILGSYFMEISMQVAKDARRAFEAEILNEQHLKAARRVLSERTADGELLSAAELTRMAEEKFDQSGLGELLEKMTEEQTITQAVIGKRVVAVAWRPVPNFDGLLSLESITLEGGLKLDIWASDHGNIVSVELVGGQHADA